MCVRREEAVLPETESIETFHPASQQFRVRVIVAQYGTSRLKKPATYVRTCEGFFTQIHGYYPPLYSYICCQTHEKYGVL